MSPRTKPTCNSQLDRAADSRPRLFGQPVFSALCNQRTLLQGASSPRRNHPGNNEKIEQICSCARTLAALVNTSTARAQRRVNRRYETTSQHVRPPMIGQPIRARFPFSVAVANKLCTQIFPVLVNLTIQWSPSPVASRPRATNRRPKAGSAAR